MGIFSKLFGKKKSKEKVRADQINNEAATNNKIEEQDSRDITLEEVESELREVSIADAHTRQPVPPKTETTLSQADEVRDRVEKEAHEKMKLDSEETQYHIKKHSKGWQLIEGSNTKATKVFDTQKEAIDYAKEKDLNYLLYRADGKLRK